MDFNAMINRAIRAAMLDVKFYNEAEADTSLNQEALMVVILVSVLSGIGACIGSIFLGVNIGRAIVSLLNGIVSGIVGYYIWAYLTQYIGTKFFGGTADVGELLRTMGYAYAPNVLGVLAIIPIIGILPLVVGAIWALVAGFIAVREALDLDNTKTFLTVVIGWVIVLVIRLIIGSVLGV